MGEWSDYFEDFPEENPANQVNGQYNPEGATRIRAQEELMAQVKNESNQLQRKMFEMAEEAKKNRQK